MEILTKAVLSNKQTLNLEEAAAFTGLATSYLYKLTSTQEIPHYKPRGKMLYFDRSELETWLRQGKVKSITEIDREAAAIVAKSKAAA
jgi:excisionase family DNA binding protein